MRQPDPPRRRRGGATTASWPEPPRPLRRVSSDRVGTDTREAVGVAIVAERAPTIVHPFPDRHPTPMATVEDLASRVERLLLRHEELQRTAGLLEQELAGVTQERDSLRSRLNAARGRIDALLARLPADAPADARADGAADATEGARP